MKSKKRKQAKREGKNRRENIDRGGEMRKENTWQNTVK